MNALLADGVLVVVGDRLVRDAPSSTPKDAL